MKEGGQGDRAPWRSSPEHAGTMWLQTDPCGGSGRCEPCLLLRPGPWTSSEQVGSWQPWREPQGLRFEAQRTGNVLKAVLLKLWSLDTSSLGIIWKPLEMQILKVYPGTPGIRSAGGRPSHPYFIRPKEWIIHKVWAPPKRGRGSWRGSKDGCYENLKFSFTKILSLLTVCFTPILCLPDHVHHFFNFF